MKLITVILIGLAFQTYPLLAQKGVPGKNIKDIDGNTYKTVKIGKQHWMAENLKTTRYQNGDLIGTTTSLAIDISNESNPKYQWAYEGNESFVESYGRLYTWYAATDERNVCPKTWHIPSDEEWSILTSYLGGASVAGGKLKETGTKHWSYPKAGLSVRCVKNSVFTASGSKVKITGIQFDPSAFSDLKANAKKEKKLIFIDAYTSWCGPCKNMANNIFTNDTVADFFNHRFINAQFDMEKGEGIEIGKLYNVLCYPNLLFIDGDGNLVHRGAGEMDAKSFIQFAEDAMNPEKRFSKFQKDYESRKDDPEFLYKYLNNISHTCLPVNDVLTSYFSFVKDEDLVSRKNWNIIRDYVSDYKSREFNYLVNNSERFAEKYTADSVNTVIVDVIIQSGFKIIGNADIIDEDYFAFKSEILKLNSPSVLEAIFSLDLNYYYGKQELKKMIDLVVNEGEVYRKKPEELIQLAMLISSFSEDTTALQKAESWMRKVFDSGELAIFWPVHEIYASILLKLGRKEDARAAVIEAIEVAKLSGLSEKEYKSSIELLKSIDALP